MGDTSITYGKAVILALLVFADMARDCEPSKHKTGNTVAAKMFRDAAQALVKGPNNG